MSKEFLKSIFNQIPDKRYVWSLYFFKIDRRARNPYKVYKIRFKNGQYLADYASNLISIVSSIQIEKMSQVQEYDGENSKVSCDKLELSHELISEQWVNLNTAVVNSTDVIIDGKINGYIITGHTGIQNDETPAIVLVKIANPIIELNNKNSIVYRNTPENELDLIADSFCRLYLTVDFIVINECLYAFNHTFEGMFEIEKTLSKVKTKAIEKIINTNSISNVDEFTGFISQYKSPRTFITLNELRTNKVTDKEGREKVANILKIPLNHEGLLVISNKDQASLLIRYLCYKIFQESETEDVLEASTVSRIQFP